MTAIWTTPKTWSIGELVTADALNEQVRDNPDYMANRPLVGTYQSSGAVYTTTSTSDLLLRQHRSAARRGGVRGGVSTGHALAGQVQARSPSSGAATAGPVSRNPRMTYAIRSLLDEQHPTKARRACPWPNNNQYRARAQKILMRMYVCSASVRTVIGAGTFSPAQVFILLRPTRPTFPLS